tara:strand:- start:269 stop:391 length:123 start_codon:yes stop_codon:yes gene_type:complete
MDKKTKRKIKECLDEIKLLTDKKYVVTYCARILRLINKGE